MEPSSIKKYVAEAIGTFALTLCGCGAAAIAGETLGSLGIAMCFGLTVVAMAFAIGDVSGCHINPAITLAAFIDGRMSAKDMVCYWVAQIIGGLIGGLVLAGIIMCTELPVALTGLGCNGYGVLSATGLSMAGALIVEVILTFLFVMTVLGSTANEKTAPYAGIIIGLTLALLVAVGLPLTGTSVNPARSFGPAVFMSVFVGDATALSQVWVFFVGPLAGGALAAVVHGALVKSK